MIGTSPALKEHQYHRMFHRRYSPHNIPVSQVPLFSTLNLGEKGPTESYHTAKGSFDFIRRAPLVVQNKHNCRYRLARMADAVTDSIPRHNGLGRQRITKRKKGKKLQRWSSASKGPPSHLEVAILGPLSYETLATTGILPATHEQAISRARPRS